MMEFIFEQLPEIPHTFLEFGAHLKEANTLLLREQGWKGWSLDATAESHDQHFSAFYIRMDTVSAMLRHLEIPLHIGLLSVDIDSFDYFLLRAILAERKADLLLLEFNEAWGPHDKYCTPPNSYIRFHCDVCYGASLGAYMELLSRPEYDYHLVKVSGHPHNAFFLKGKFLSEKYIQSIKVTDFVTKPFGSVYRDNVDAFRMYGDHIKAASNCENPTKMFTCEHIKLWSDICRVSPKGGRYCNQLPGFERQCKNAPLKVWDGAMLTGSRGSDHSYVNDQ
eukprot:TRINITY_DN14502_c0_g1_i2.p1 TRINITY_DN14502_c0_g1~~TRINITY_DN14502_c0_g1_i2.p1  ORF type:complete len:279 (-),score=22.50 TRINITY_DN14502_c0_g1_i2:184-1020(-)